MAGTNPQKVCTFGLVSELDETVQLADPAGSANVSDRTHSLRESG